MSDPAIDAIRQARHQISRACGNDPARLIEHYRQMQNAFAGRIIRGPDADATQQGVAPDGAAEQVALTTRS